MPFDHRVWKSGSTETAPGCKLFSTFMGVAQASLDLSGFHLGLENQELCMHVSE